MRTTVPAPTAGTADKSAEVTVELYDFGTPDTVTAPPASQVSDLKSLLSPGSN